MVTLMLINWGHGFKPTKQAGVYCMFGLRIKFYQCYLNNHGRRLLYFNSEVVLLLVPWKIIKMVTYCWTQTTSTYFAILAFEQS